MKPTWFEIVWMVFLAPSTTWGVVVLQLALLLYTDIKSLVWFIPSAVAAVLSTIFAYFTYQNMITTRRLRKLSKQLGEVVDSTELGKK